MSERIGFIGLGVMGQPMVRNLVAAGFELVVHTRSAAVLDAFQADGIAVGADRLTSRAGRTSSSRWSPTVRPSVR